MIMEKTKELLIKAKVYLLKKWVCVYDDNIIYDSTVHDVFRISHDVTDVYHGPLFIIQSNPDA